MVDVHIEYGILNIVAHPHGESTYQDVLRRAANQEVKFWGELNAAIKEPREVEPGIFQSAIVIGVEIDLSEPLIDRNNLVEVSAEDTSVTVSNEYLYNGKFFYIHL